MFLPGVAPLRSLVRLVSPLALFLCLMGPALSQEVHLVVSSSAGDRLTEKPSIHFQKSSSAPGLRIEIHDDVHYQTIDGFGASFLEAGLMCINSLPPREQEAVLRSLFDSTSGAGFSAMKTVIASTDFMSAGPFYSYDPTPGDVEMKQFSISRDLAPDGLITYIKRARRYGTFVLQAPMDYPPDWMLFDVNKRQDVNPKYYDALALYYLRYLQEYMKNGVFVDYISLFNEPGNYTKIPYNEINELLRDHVGPLLKRAGTRTQIMPGEAPTRENARRNYPVILDDPATRKYIAVVPYHGYDLKHFEDIAALHQRYPQFPLWMTELCYDHEGVETPKSMVLPRYDFEDGDFWGKQIFGDLEASASAWIYWNMVLDERGGPWSVSVVHGNPDPNEQQPVVIVNQQTKKVSYTGLYYYLAHFSKFVRPGSVRLQTAGAAEGVRVMSFGAPHGKIVTELMNSNKTTANVNLTFHGNILHLELPAISITTAMWLDPGAKPVPPGGQSSDAPR
jgi:O-glycosyl hydrolase